MSTHDTRDEGRILRLEGEYVGVRYGNAAIPERMTAAEIFDRLSERADDVEGEIADLLSDHCIDFQGIPEDAGDTCDWLAQQVLARLQECIGGEVYRVVGPPVPRDTA